MTDETQSMKDIDHTHPYGGRSAGALFARGPVVAADGGEPSEGRRSSSEVSSDGGRDTEENGRMKDVDHTPPHGEEGATRVFERGEEYETVEE